MNSRIKPRVRATGGIPLTTACPGLEARKFSGYQSDEDLAASGQIMAVANAQPHRVAFRANMPSWVAEEDGKPLESPLGRFCAYPKMDYPNGLGKHCYMAGVEFRRVVSRALKATEMDSSEWHGEGNGYRVMTEAEIAEARREALRRERESDGVLVGVDRRLKDAVRDLCCKELEPKWQHEGILIGGLTALSVEYGFYKPYHRA